MNGCYQYVGMSDYVTSKQNGAAAGDQGAGSQGGNDGAGGANNQAPDYEAAPLRRRRRGSSFQNQTNDMKAFCSRYAVLEKTIDCKVKIKISFTLKLL